MSAPAAVGGNRLMWTDLPARVCQIIEDQLGATVVQAVSQAGGFSPGLASRLLLADGRRVFAKAVSATRNADSTAAHRREALILAALPAAVAAPRLLWFGECEDWSVLLIEDVDGRTPTLPWLPAEFDEAVSALAAFADLLTPSPIEVAGHVVGECADDFNGWRCLASQPAQRPAEFDWAWHNLDQLVDLERAWPAAAADGTTLMHGDLRADNMLVTARGLMLVDWPSAVVGPAWMDLLCMMPSAIMQGIADPERVWRGYRPARGVDPDAVNAVLAAIAGYFVSRSLQPPPPNLPRLRPFQAAQGRAASGWLRQRLR
jgi:hypothetical protein